MTDVDLTGRPEARLIRSDALYVSWQTRKGLGYVPREGTVDELADQILADWLKTNHPRIVQHMKEQSELDKAFRKGLKGDAKRAPENS